MYQACAKIPEPKRRKTTEGEKEENKFFSQQRTNTLNNNPAKILIVGYSPTGGGHTARTLNIVKHALNSGTLPAGSQVWFHVPPHWEGTPRPTLLKTVVSKLVEKNIRVIFAESDKPVYGYLNATTGASNDPEILRRIALHPLRNKERNEKKSFFE